MKKIKDIEYEYCYLNRLYTAIKHRAVIGPHTYAYYEPCSEAEATHLVYKVVDACEAVGQHFASLAEEHGLSYVRLDRPSIELYRESE